MSVTAIRWAYEVPLKKASERHLLVSLADYGDEDGLCFPSISTLVRKTILNKRTILKGLVTLKDAGYIVDTGKRKGRSSQIIVYQVNVRVRSSKSTGRKKAARPGAVLPLVPGAVLPSSSMVYEPSLNHQKEPSEIAVAIPKSLNTPDFQDAFRSWVAYRKLPPISQDALLKNLMRFGPDQAAERIRQAIAGQWLNVSMEDRNTNSSKPQDFLRKRLSHMKTCRIHRHEFDTRVKSICPLCYPDTVVSKDRRTNELVGTVAEGMMGPGKPT